jgi:hypothetical protein
LSRVQSGALIASAAAVARMIVAATASSQSIGLAASIERSGE